MKKKRLIIEKYWNFVIGRFYELVFFTSTSLKLESTGHLYSVDHLNFFADLLGGIARRGMKKELKTHSEVMEARAVLID